MCSRQFFGRLGDIALKASYNVTAMSQELAAVGEARFS